MTIVYREVYDALRKADISEDVAAHLAKVPNVGAPRRQIDRSTGLLADWPLKIFVPSVLMFEAVMMLRDWLS